MEITEAHFMAVEILAEGTKPLTTLDSERGIIQKVPGNPLLIIGLRVKGLVQKVLKTGEMGTLAGAVRTGMERKANLITDFKLAI